MSVGKKVSSNIALIVTRTGLILCLILIHNHNHWNLLALSLNKNCTFSVRETLKTLKACQTEIFVITIHKKLSQMFGVEWHFIINFQYRFKNRQNKVKQCKCISWVFVHKILMENMENSVKLVWIWRGRMFTFMIK